MYKTFLALISVSMTVIGYTPYIKDILNGKTKPHLFTWFIWTFLTAIAFAIQINSGAGIGSLTLGSVLIANILIFILSLRYGSRIFTGFDWICMGLGSIAMFIWMSTDNPVAATVFLTIAVTLGFIPTFNKSFHHPEQETLFAYILNALKQLLGILALDAWKITTILFPASLVILNGTLALFLFFRRSHMNIQ